MAKDTDQLAGSFATENTGGLLGGFLAEENVFDRRTLWRIASWGAASVGAIILAVYANQSSIQLRRDLVAASDLAWQAQQLQSVAKESQNETRRLASAIDTLNGDRDRLYSRVTVLEQGLDSVTGAIARQNAAAPQPPAAATPAPTSEPPTAAQNPAPAAVVAPAPAPAPVVAPVTTTTVAKTTDKPAAEAVAPEQAPATASSVAPKASNTPAATPATPLVAAKSMMAPPDAAASKLIEPEKPEKPEKAEKPAKAITAAPMPEVVASTSAAEDAEAAASDATAAKLGVQRTEFGVDVGGANSVAGLRALWRGLLKSRSNAPLTALRPIIVVKENNTGLGMQLRLVAGPLSDAAAAAKICAVMIENDRSCETTVFDGQSLVMKADEPAAPPAKPASRRRSFSKRVTVDEPQKKPASSSSLSALFGRR